MYISSVVPSDDVLPPVKKNNHSPPAGFFHFQVFTAQRRWVVNSGAVNIHIFLRWICHPCWLSKVFVHLVWRIESLPVSADINLSISMKSLTLHEPGVNPRWGVIWLGVNPPPPSWHNTPVAGVRFSNNTASNFEVWLKWEFRKMKAFNEFTESPPVNRWFGN